MPVKAWVKGVPVEKDAADQLLSLAKLPIIHSHVAAMPDMHLGKGACVGCVVATVDAIIPAAVGVVSKQSTNYNNFLEALGFSLHSVLSW